MDNIDRISAMMAAGAAPINYRMVPHLTLITGKLTGNDREKNAIDKFNRWAADDSVISPKIVNVTVRDNIMIIIVEHVIPVLIEEGDLCTDTI